MRFFARKQVNFAILALKYAFKKCRATKCKTQTLGLFFRHTNLERKSRKVNKICKFTNNYKYVKKRNICLAVYDPSFENSQGTKIFYFQLNRANKVQILSNFKFISFLTPLYFFKNRKHNINFLLYT